MGDFNASPDDFLSHKVLHSTHRNSKVPARFHLTYYLEIHGFQDIFVTYNSLPIPT